MRRVIIYLTCTLLFGALFAQESTVFILDGVAEEFS